MTADLSNLSLASPYPFNETIQTANGEGLQVSHIGNTMLQTSVLRLSSLSAAAKSCLFCFFVLSDLSL
jgi:hypothetical protein